MGDVFDEPDGLELLEWKKKGARCKGWNHEVPFEDKGMCGWCLRMLKHQIGI